MIAASELPLAEASASAPAGVLLAFALYLSMILLVGFLSMRFSSAGLGEYFLGGRSLRAFVVALSAVVSGRSAWLIVGASGLAFSIGAAAVWAVPGYVIAEMILFVTVGRRLREATGRAGDLTLPDFYASRFPERARSLRATAALFIVLFFVVYVAAQFEAGGKVMDASFPSFGLGHAGWVVVTAGIVLLYTVLGGFLAVSLTDAIQAGFMIFALIVLPVVAIVDLGGLGALWRELYSQDPSLLDPLAAGAASAVGLLAIGLGSPGNPHILIRYMSIRDPRHLRTSALVGTIWNVAMGWGAIFAGLAGRALFRDVASLPGGDRENLFAHLASHELHPFLHGLVLAAIFAAIMSTADSQLLVAASAVVRDLYQGLLGFGRDLSQRSLVLRGRIVTALLVAAAVSLLAVARGVVFWFVLFAWGGLGAAFGSTVLLALYWRRVNGAGVLAGLWVGALVVIAWKGTGLDRRLIYELVPAFPAALAATVLVSLATGRDRGSGAASEEGGRDGSRV